MNDLWYPKAQRNLVLSGIGAFKGGPNKGVLHTAESKSIPSILSTYRNTKNYPQITVGTTVEQHCPVNVGSTALQNLTGGVETNFDGAVQIEIAWMAADIANLPDEIKANLVDVMRWLQDEMGIQPIAPVFKTYPASYGTNNGVRFSNQQWDNFNGWCGHQHVPENVHGDPGALDIQWFLNQIKTKSTPPIIIRKGTPIKMDVTPHLVDIPNLDANGNGWVLLDVPVEKVISMVKWGPAPDRDGGYDNPGWPDFELKLNNTGGKAKISIESDVPNGHVSFTVWVAA